MIRFCDKVQKFSMRKTQYLKKSSYPAASLRIS